MLQIGSVRVDPPLLLAPMAGVTDRDFRSIVRRIGGAGVVGMEFISSKGLVREDRRVLDLLPFGEEERPLSIQIYGGDVETMTAAAREVERLGPDLCDINMGCPANAVLRGCAGAALMGDLRQAEKILQSVRRALTIPVTVKFRLGLDDGRRNYLELGRIAEAAGLDAVALHARTARQGFRGPADWSHIARLKEAVGLPVIGNGDVTSADHALRMFAETGCDGVMIGRAATKNPWIFAEIAARRGAATYREPTLDDRRELVLGHFRAVAARDEPHLALHKLRKFTGWYSYGLPGGHELRRRINQPATVDEFLDEIEAFFDRQLDQREAA